VSGTTGFQVLSVSVADGVTWALGTADCPPVDCTAVARSTDGGRSWRGVTAPPAYVPGPGLRTSRLPVPGLVRTVRFGTARDGYVVGGGLWSTHDGGASWAAVPLDDLEVLGLDTGPQGTYAVVADCGDENGAPCRDPRLLAAPAGDDALTDVADLPAGPVDPATVQVTLDPTGPGVPADEPRDGGPGGERPVAGAAGPAVVAVGSEVLVSAGDGWVRSEPCGALGGAVAAASGEVVAACVEAALGSRFVSLRRSADGVTWSTPAGPSPRLTDGVLSLAAATGDAVVVGWTGTQDDGGLLTTRDGGRTWAGTRPGRPRPVVGRGHRRTGRRPRRTGPGHRHLLDQRRRRPDLATGTGLLTGPGHAATTFRATSERDDHRTGLVRRHAHACVACAVVDAPRAPRCSGPHHAAYGAPDPHGQPGSRHLTTDGSGTTRAGCRGGDRHRGATP
jgi:hypothetical protein